PALRDVRRPASDVVAPQVRAALDEASRLRRGGAPEGREHLLGPAERARFEALFAQLPAARAERLAAMLERPRGEAAPVARALLLRAQLARLPALVESDRPFAILDAFAAALEGRSSRELLTRSTVLDLDSEKNDSALDPNVLFEHRGVIHPRGDGDRARDNDGLFQRFTASCGPTVIQMLMGQADPVFAFALHDAGLTSTHTDDPAGRLQRELLEGLGGVALGLEAAQLRARVRNALGRVVRDGALDERSAKALRRHVERRGPMTRSVAHALEVLRDRYDGFPTTRDVTELRKSKLAEHDEGIDGRALQRALDGWVSPLTGNYYRSTTPLDGFARGQAWRHVDAVARALAAGIDVPFGISEPGHWMMASAVAGEKPNRRFLVSDPAGGRTAWVDEPSFLRGTFVRDVFELCTGDERGYIDTFFLPIEPQRPNRKAPRGPVIA
ncbi:hypothetical protein L6R52_39635, partial [Myxococcota bacterium]|nr:hypothetical protein [Myxococcota bacterium]